MTILRTVDNRRRQAAIAAENARVQAEIEKQRREEEEKRRLEEKRRQEELARIEALLLRPKDGAAAAKRMIM